MAGPKSSQEQHTGACRLMQRLQLNRQEHARMHPVVGFVSASWKCRDKRKRHGDSFRKVEMHDTITHVQNIACGICTLLGEKVWDGIEMRPLPGRIAIGSKSTSHNFRGELSSWRHPEGDGMALESSRIKSMV